ncbi:MAG: FAD-binding domain-containing protein [Betaproteobacteria bacterium]|jgi:deoxyribodipyrimidine photo-lyase
MTSLLPSGHFTWAPTRDAALARVATVSPSAYGRTRNALDGAVTRLSPWITHGFVDLPEVLAAVRERHRVPSGDRFVFELAWREYFHHVWRHLGEGIFGNLRLPVWAGEYSASVPEDVRTACTGVPVIDASVRQLYATGYLHNHQRLWLAAYVVHLRKVHWFAGAQWMYAHLLDGDLASNCLSWQWCAGTFSSKPYLFNAENVARYAPHLASPGTAVDRPYPELDMLARTRPDVGPESGRRPVPVSEPSCPAGPGVPDTALTADDLTGRRIGLVHPWSLRAPSDCDLILGVIHKPFHDRFAWSALRWDFVLGGMRPLVRHIWMGDLAELAGMLQRAASVTGVATLNPGYAAFMGASGHGVVPVPRITADPDAPCRSFSAFWSRVSRGL